MIVSKNWLQQFVDISKIDPQEIADRLILHSAEVDGWWRQDAYLEGVVIGVVKSVSKHPDADRLQLCKVFDGKKTFQVVCGGSNIREGMKCAFASIGSKVKWHGDQEVVLEPVKIRGKKSEGMICAAAEIGLAMGDEEEKEIMDLSHLDDAAGTSLAKALDADDIFFDIDNKSINNRPDMWGHLGVARELSVIFKKPLNIPEPPAVTAGQPWSLKIDISAPKKCKRYQGVIVENVAVRPSPDWMARRLKACGIKAINNVVDITNWVQLELGQPMHAFDVGRLTVGQDAASIKVREARKSESIVALDEQKYQLQEGMLVIADERAPIAIAGVIGGKDSGVSDKTETVLFESAHFDPATVRKTASALGVRTQSSARFEKTLDPALTSFAMRRALQLLMVVSPDARIASPTADVGLWKMPHVVINLSAMRVNAVLGITLKTKDIKNILEQLGCDVSGRGKTLKVSVPSWRATRDISIQEDLIEEIGRMWGYDNIPSSLPQMSIAPPPISPEKRLVSEIRSMMHAQLHYDELLSHSFANERMLTLLGGSTEDLIEMENPLSADARFLRESLVPGVLSRVESELHTTELVSVFEIGNVFDSSKTDLPISEGSQKKLPAQHKELLCAYARKGEKNPFAQVRRIFEIINSRSESKLTLKPAQSAKWAHPGRSADIMLGQKKVGFITELHPTYAKNIGVKQKVGFLGLDLTEFSRDWQPTVSYKKMSDFPSARRDLAVLVDKDVAYEQLHKVISESSEHISTLKLFDTYTGEKVGSGKKSLAMHLEFSHPEKTLTSEEVESEINTIIRALKKKTGARER